MLIVKNIENNTVYSVLELHSFLCSSIFSVHSSISYQLIFSYIYNLSNLDTHRYHKIYHIHTQLLGFQINPLPHTLYLPILYIHAYIYLHSNVVYCCKHLHLVYIYIYTFHAILYASFHLLLTLD